MPTAASRARRGWGLRMPRANWLGRRRRATPPRRLIRPAGALQPPEAQLWAYSPSVHTSRRTLPPASDQVSLGVERGATCGPLRLGLFPARS